MFKKTAIKQFIILAGQSIFGWLVFAPTNCTKQGGINHLLFLMHFKIKSRHLKEIFHDAHVDFYVKLLVNVFFVFSKGHVTEGQ